MSVIFHPDQMGKIRRTHLDHVSPEWIDFHANYFVTICTTPRGVNQLCQPEVGRAALNAIEFYHQKTKWFCHIAVLMPDHVHMFLSFPDIASIASVIGAWKRWLTVNQGVTWQENFFDHRIRGEDGDKYKSDYVLNNPVRAGLVDDARKWPYLWLPRDPG